MPSNKDDLLLRALDVIEKAYGCYEFLQYARTEETDQVLEDLVAAVGPKLEPAP